MWSQRLPRLGSLLSRQNASMTGAAASSSSSTSAVSSEASTSRLQFSTCSRACDESSRNSSSFPSSSYSSSSSTSSFLPGFHSAGRGGNSFARVGGGGGGGFVRSEAFNLHVKASRNNTIITLTTPQGQPISRVTSGMCGFKKSGRSGYEAGHQSAMRMFGIIQENQLKWRLANLNVIFNGFGLGREAVYRALMTDDGVFVRNLVRRLADSTRIRIGGCRPKKRRML